LNIKIKLTTQEIFEKIDYEQWGKCIEVKSMDNIKLTAKDILEKEFKSGIKGYKQEDVDKYLDLIIKDYEVFQQVIEDLRQENQRLRRQLEDSNKKQPVPQTGTTNFDILKRLSNLEKHVFGSKLFD
jgi:DivIVA domain-containing protein